MSYRWMKKSVVLSALLLMALPVLAFAQTSRLEGMTLQGDYVKDYTNIYAYPSQVPNVGNLFYGEVGNTGGRSGVGFGIPSGVTDRSVGSVLGNLFDGRYGVWAIHLRETTPNLGQGDAVNGPVLARDPNRNTHESIDLMWGRKMGTTSIGLRYNRSHFQNETNSPTVTTTLAFDPTFVTGPTTADSTNQMNLSRNINGFGGGISFEMNPNSTAEVSLLYENRSWENTTSPRGTVVNGSEDGPTSYLLSGRMMWQWQSNIMVTPVAKFYSYDLSRKQVAASTQSFDNSLKGWQLGAAANWSLGSNDLMVWGIDFTQNKVVQADPLFTVPGLPAAVADSSDITETITPRLFAALETHVNSWLTLRMGASKGAYSKVKVEPDGNPTKDRINVTTTSFDMNLGAGVKVGTLQFDAVLANNTYQFANGLLGGTTPTGGFFPKVTATYSF